MLCDARVHPALGFVKPRLERGLTVARGAQGNDGLQLFHPVDQRGRSKGHAKAKAAKGFRLGRAHDGDQFVGPRRTGPQMGIAFATIKQPRIQLIHDQGQIILRRKICDPRDSGLAKNLTRRIVRCRKDKHLCPRLARGLQRIKIGAILVGCVVIPQRNRQDLSAKEPHQFAVGEIIRLDDSHLGALIHNSAKRQKQRALCARCNDQLVHRIDRSAGKTCKASGHIRADLGSAAIFGIGLRATQIITRLPSLARARRGRKGIHVTMGKINRTTGDHVTAHHRFQVIRVLSHLLAGRVFGPQVCELRFQIAHTRLPSAKSNQRYPSSVPRTRPEWLIFFDIQFSLAHTSRSPFCRCNGWQLPNK